MVSSLVTSSSTALAKRQRRYAPAVIFDIPDADTPEFMNEVEEDERTRIRELFRAFREIDAAPTIAIGVQRSASARAHLGWGWSAKSLDQLFRLYVHGGYKPGDTRKEGACFTAGDWRSLIRTYKGKTSSLPGEFLSFWKGIVLENKGRDDIVAASWKHLVYDVWLMGKPIPGYGTVDDWCLRTGRARPNPMLVRPGELPEGWDERTLRRYVPKRKATRKQAAHGYLAAHGYQADQVLTDRTPLQIFERLFIDDIRFDKRALWLQGSRGQIVYPLGVLSLDAACGVDTAFLTKPRALDEDTGKRLGITADMSFQLVLNHVRRWGLPTGRAITFVHENAAACLTREQRSLLDQVFGDRIQFEATSIFRSRMLEHGFTEQGGCPWSKAPIEVFFRVLQTHLSRDRGSTGPRYDDAHGSLVKMEEYTLQLVERAGGIQSIIDQLRTPIPRWEQTHNAIERALELLRFRINHSLQGFERIVEWRRSPADNYRPESELQALAPEEQAQISDIITRLESPAERCVRLLQGVQLEPIDPDLLTWLEGPRRKVTVRNGKIAIKSIDHASEPLIFREVGHTLLEEECEGHTFEGVLTPDGDRLVLSQDGRILGAIDRQARIAANDKEALLRETGRVMAARTADREQLRGYLLDEDRRLAADQEHSERVLSQVPSIQAPAPTPRISQRARERRRDDLTAELAEAARESLSDASEAPQGGLYDADSP
jgi:hypothetical protein